MTSKLIQATARVKALEELADEVLGLAKKLHENQNVQPELRNKTERWYRGARELLNTNAFSGLKDFEDCYNSAHSTRRAYSDIEKYTSLGINPHQADYIKYAESLEYFGQFSSFFTQARAILVSLLDEILSRELPITTQLSFAVVADEFEIAEKIFESNKNNEVMLRAAGVICRVALERHMHVLIESRGLQIILNPPQKSKADFSDLLVTLEKNTVISAVQKSELESLNKKGNNCAHPKEAITVDDVKQLTRRGKELCSLIL